MKKADAALKNLVQKDYIANHYDADTAIYHIHYYFEKHATFIAVSNLSIFLNSLERLKISDWKVLNDNPAAMKKYLGLLEKHYEYVNAYMKCREFEESDT